MSPTRKSVKDRGEPVSSLVGLLAEARRAAALRDGSGLERVENLSGLVYAETEANLGKWAAEEAARHMAELLADVDALGPDAGWFADHIVGFKICNWRLEPALEEFLRAVGERRPLSSLPPAGHERSVSEERWLRIWSYFLHLRRWLLPRERLANVPSAMVALGDQDGQIGEQIHAALGAPDELKELYVRRFCQCLETWLYELRDRTGAVVPWHREAEQRIERRIGDLRPGYDILNAMLSDREDRLGGLNPCHYRLFQRYDLIIASIGAGKWQRSVPAEPSSRQERGSLLRAYTDPMGDWLAGRKPMASLGRRLCALLGKPDPAKRFWVGALFYWHRPAQLAAEAGDVPWQAGRLCGC